MLFSQSDVFHATRPHNNGTGRHSSGRVYDAQQRQENDDKRHRRGKHQAQVIRQLRLSGRLLHARGCPILDDFHFR